MTLWDKVRPRYHQWLMPILAVGLFLSRPGLKQFFLCLALFFAVPLHNYFYFKLTQEMRRED